MIIKYLTLLMDDRIICDALNRLPYLICDILFCGLSCVWFIHLFTFIYYLWICEWTMSVIVYIAYQLYFCILICDDWMMLHYCVKPLDHTHTHINMDFTRKSIKSQILKWFLKVEYLNSNGLEMFWKWIGFKVKSFWNGISKMKFILNNLIEFWNLSILI